MINTIQGPTRSRHSSGLTSGNVKPFDPPTPERTKGFQSFKGADITKKLLFKYIEDQKAPPSDQVDSYVNE